MVFEIGTIVLAKVKGHPWWPGTVENYKELPENIIKRKRIGRDGRDLIPIKFIGSSDYGLLMEGNLKLFTNEDANGILKKHKKNSRLVGAINKVQENLASEKNKATSSSKIEQLKIADPYRRYYSNSSNRNKIKYVNHNNNSENRVGDNQASANKIRPKRGRKPKRKNIKKHNKSSGQNIGGGDIAVVNAVNRKNKKRSRADLSDDEKEEVDNNSIVKRKIKRRNITTSEAEVPVIRKSLRLQNVNTNGKVAKELKETDKIITTTTTNGNQKGQTQLADKIVRDDKRLLHLRHILQKLALRDEKDEVELKIIDEAIKEVENSFITIEILKKSKMGIVMRMISEKSFNEDHYKIVERSQNLVNKWKEMLSKQFPEENLSFENEESQKEVSSSLAS
ncbi:280_t:CDS:2 [Entrophospora sp. SA101]|nr:5092_t:CDS:2 [Entrophospora sp. SA101]CAJ0644863.1 13531_t:CDS:2 [Entrophospora sp. SA101]CAJ0764402.1 280_t:CDS:2 [Entrophospora sp. SA101]CAJ0837452.1 13039_t:CDS:2 [Entrophospora sp. SA101]CAJ0874396.1 9254_t:CDS:2 [Entrophospora sp. SA101]